MMNLGIFSIVILIYLLIFAFYVCWVYPRRKKSIKYKQLHRSL